MIRPTKTRGLTLIELVAAMAIFALVAVMGIQSLTGMIRQRDALSARSDRAQELAVASALIRADMSAVAPLMFYPPNRAAPRSSVAQVKNGFALSIAGQPGLNLTAAPAMHRVEYVLDPQAKVLSRRIWPTLTPANPNAVSSDFVILTGVNNIRLRSYPSHQTGWINGLTPPLPPLSTPTANDGDVTGGAPEVYSSALPMALEITLELTDLGTVPLLEALQ